jgi:hypothetical protein
MFADLRSTHRISICLWLIGVLLLTPLQAQQPTNTDHGVKLIIKPHICVAPRGEASCISWIDVFWESEQATDLCLYVSEQDQSLKCWQQQRAGSHRHHVTLADNLDFWLASIRDNTLLASSTVKFAALQPHRKHNRRRNALPWSFQTP